MELPLRRFVTITLLSWIAFLAVDFLVHGAVLAEFYTRGSPALLPLGQAFALIPLGYLSFLLIVGLVVWLEWKLSIRGALPGLRFGLLVGSLLAAAHGLGLASITTVDPMLILWWSVAEAIEIGAAGYVAGWALASDRLARLGVVVLAGALLLMVLTIALQNI